MSMGYSRNALRYTDNRRRPLDQSESAADFGRTKTDYAPTHFRLSIETWFLGAFALNFDEYEKKQYRLYSEFAEIIQFILEQAITSAGGPRPQLITCRAKDPSRLRARLEEAGSLDHPNIESVRRDLAGARIIFYLDSDVNKFNQSRLIWDNFEVEDPKVHHPTADNESRYRGIHYTVRLRDDRTNLPEYAKFKGLRCEIQIQTGLHHIWSETSHDIVYKGKAPPGFGSRAMKSIERAFNRIMDEHLLPAGREIQRAQTEYERLMAGKELFDADVVRQLEMAENNNARHDILTRLKDDTIPNYDDIHSAFGELREPLIRAVRAARNTPKVPMPTPYGDMEGYDTNQITRTVIEIIDQLRYAEPVETLKMLTAIYREETEGDIRKKIMEVVKNLAEFNIPAWDQVGPGVQFSLVDYLATLSNEELVAIQPIALTVWGEALQGDITGTKWTADAMTLSTGAIPASEPIRKLRASVIVKLFEQFDLAKDDGARLEILHALDNATRTPTNAQYSDELRALTLENARQIVEFLTARVDALSFELLQHVEHGFLYDYYRVKGSDE